MCQSGYTKIPEEFTGTYNSSFFPENVEYIDTCCDVEPLLADTAGKFPGTEDWPTAADAIIIDIVPRITITSKILFNHITPEFLLYMPNPDLPLLEFTVCFYF